MARPGETGHAERSRGVTSADGGAITVPISSPLFLPINILKTSLPSFFIKSNHYKSGGSTVTLATRGGSQGYNRDSRVGSCHGKPTCSPWHYSTNSRPGTRRMSRMKDPLDSLLGCYCNNLPYTYRCTIPIHFHAYHTTPMHCGQGFQQAVLIDGIPPCRS